MTAGVVCVALLGGAGLGAGFNLVGDLAAREAPPVTVAATKPEAPRPAPKPSGPNPAEEYAKYQNVTATLERCHERVRRGGYDETSDLYEDANKMRADAVRQAFYDRAAASHADTAEKVGALAERGQTKAGIVGMLADGSFREMQRSAFTMTEQMSEAFGGGRILVGTADEASCEAFALKVKFGEYDLAYF